VLPNQHLFVGYGNLPFFAEYDANGNLVMDALFPGSDLTYRAIKIPASAWVGLPLTPPSGAARQSGGRATVYASWNGATQVASWRVLAGPRAGQLSAVATAARSGFETAIAVRQDYQVYEVQALDAHGRVLGTSRSFRAR
ncbi:MAG TPA: hypothetical protein VF834_15495, partial [Streptosporangiaceae bacterium]